MDAFVIQMCIYSFAIGATFGMWIGTAMVDPVKKKEKR